MRPWFERVVEASDEDAFYKCFGAATKPDPNERPDVGPIDPLYEQWYEPLEKRIVAAAAGAGVPPTAIELFDDWVPNRTRHVTIERDHVGPAVISALHGLLVDDYRDWRIEVIVLVTIGGDDRVANIGLWRDWVLCWGIGRSLLPLTGTTPGEWPKHLLDGREGHMTDVIAHEIDRLRAILASVEMPF